MAKGRSVAPKVKMPGAMKLPKAPSMGSKTAPNVGSGLASYVAASKMLSNPKPQRNGLSVGQ